LVPGAAIEGADATTGPTYQPVKKAVLIKEGIRVVFIFLYIQ
jgi:hypothetical protein